MVKDLELRQVMEQRERGYLGAYAQLSCRSRGRVRDEPPCPIRTAFQRDRDRIIHSKAFRRLKHKTQVFIAPEGDHYRTRLTHTLEVAQTSRTIARSLALNEDLAEAIALGHDLGHTPFGHGGEQVFDQVLEGGFRHYEQSLRVVDVLEDDGGLNLSWEVRDGIFHHSGDRKAATMEGRIVSVADRIAYLNHDIDDAVRAGLLTIDDLPSAVVTVIGQTSRERINTFVADLIRESMGRPDIVMSEPIKQALVTLRQFMFDRVYGGSSPAKEEQGKAQELLRRLLEMYTDKPDKLPARYRDLGRVTGPTLEGSKQDDRLTVEQRAAVDYLASMTDRFAIRTFQREFMPRGWYG